jgi:hypothetical protein
VSIFFFENYKYYIILDPKFFKNGSTFKLALISVNGVQQRTAAIILRLRNSRFQMDWNSNFWVRLRCRLRFAIHPTGRGNLE